MASDPKLVWEQAAKGDPAAQLFLARAHDAAGKVADAQTWLSRSIASDYPPAYAYRGERALIAGGYTEAYRDLERAAHRNDPGGQRLLAQMLMAGLHGGARDWRGGIGWLIKAAAAHDKAAMRDVALFLDMVGAGGSDLLLQHAAQLGDAISVHLNLQRAAHGSLQLSQARADVYRQTLGAIGFPLVEKAPGPPPPFPSPDILQAPDWPQIGAALAEQPAHSGGAQNELSVRPRVAIVRALMTADECAYVIAMAAPLLAPACVVDPLTGVGRQDPMRTNLAMAFAPGRMTCVMTQLALRLSDAAKTPLDHAEPPGVLAYSPGQEYRPHFDWLGAGQALDRGGQRIRTALVYLNQGYGGGQTRFLDPGLDVAGREGDCAIFDNVTADGAPDMTSRHAGMPVTSGVKYLWSQWYRESPYRH